jgi:Na+/H+-translocating membrane pyrophosphatase
MLLCVTLLLLSSSDKVTTSFHGAFYTQMFFFSLMLLVCAGISFIIMGVNCEDEDELPVVTASSVRLQILIGNAVVFVMSILWPYWIYPGVFDMGTEADEGFFTPSISRGDAYWCLCIGLALQTILLFYGEFLVSHYFTPTRSVYNSSNMGASFGLIVSNAISNISQIGLFFVLGIVLILCFSMSGFFGIATCMVGLMGIPVTILAINFLAGIV